MLSYNNYRFRACFFDLDDTLIDAMDCHHKANFETFTLYGLDYEDILAKSLAQGWDPMGQRLLDIFQHLHKVAGLSGSSVTVDELLAVRSDKFLYHVEHEAKLLPGAKQSIEYAKQAGCITAITTSGKKNYLELVMKKFGFNNIVDFCLTAEDVSLGKPDPEIYNKAHERANAIQTLSKQQCLVIEDSVNGAMSAVKAEIPVCFVPLFSYRGEVQYVLQLKNLLEFPKRIHSKAL